MKEVKGSKVTLQRGGETKIRAKNNLKVLPKMPQELSNVAGFRPRRRDDAMLDLGSNAGSRTKSRDDAKLDLGSNAGVKTRRRSHDELDLEVDWKTIQAMGDQPDAQGPRPGEEGQEEEGHDRRKRAKRKRNAKKKGLPPRRRDAKKKGLPPKSGQSYKSFPSPRRKKRKKEPKTADADAAPSSRPSD